MWMLTGEVSTWISVFRFEKTLIGNLIVGYNDLNMYMIHIDLWYLLVQNNLAIKKIDYFQSDDIIVIGNKGNIFIIYIRPYKDSSSNEKSFHLKHI